METPEPNNKEICVICNHEGDLIDMIFLKSWYHIRCFSEQINVILPYLIDRPY